MLKRLSWRIQPVEQIKKRKQALIGAARLLKNNCLENDCGDCLFWQIRGYGGCQLQFTAKNWDMPEA